MLMDLFHDSVRFAPKRRVQFHEFMLEVHDRLRAERVKETGDPIPAIVNALAAEAKLLCFDEMVVNNTADAMVLSRLFTGLIGKGVVVVTTSNRSEEHTSELQSLMRISYAVFCLKKKTTTQ